MLGIGAGPTGVDKHPLSGSRLCPNKEADYNSNRRTVKRKTRSKKLPGVSPLVYSRFLLEYTAFLSLSDMGKDLPDYEEIRPPAATLSRTPCVTFSVICRSKISNCAEDFAGQL
mgnify:CR=1 FL=1